MKHKETDAEAIARLAALNGPGEYSGRVPSPTDDDLRLFAGYSYGSLLTAAAELAGLREMERDRLWDVRLASEWY